MTEKNRKGTSDRMRERKKEKVVRSVRNIK